MSDNKTTEITKIGIIGAGQMGHGIAQVAALSGYAVTLSDISEDALQKGIAGIEKSLGKFVAKERLTPEDRDAALGRISTTTSLKDAAQADLIIEAATENEVLKFKIFGELDQHAPAHAILATNTSSISITRIAAQTQRPEKVIGMHFMNPVPIMKLVEVIRGLATDDATYAAVVEAAEKIDRKSTRLNSSHVRISYAVFCLKKKKTL